MAMARFPVYDLYGALLAEGFKLPDECAEARLTLPLDGVAQLHLVINLTESDLARVGRALQRVGRPLDAVPGVHINVKIPGGCSFGGSDGLNTLVREITHKIFVDDSAVRNPR